MRLPLPLSDGILVKHLMNSVLGLGCNFWRISADVVHRYFLIAAIKIQATNSFTTHQ
jgi:hypothetical protein